MNCRPSMSGRIMSSTTTAQSGEAAFSSASAAVLACSTRIRSSCDRSATSNLRTDSVSSTTRTIGLRGIQRGYHAMPTRPLEVPDQRHSNRHEREQHEHPGNTFDSRIESRVDVQIERDAFQIVHQHPALPFLVPGEEIGIVDQAAAEKDHINLYEKCYECA